ncbi:MAG TPA: hypothetical protein VI299_15080 [Polyangiales bacterium]
MHKSRWCLVLGLLAACAGSSMRTPADVAAGSDALRASDRERWGVRKGRDSFQLGAYRVQDVERDPVTQSGYSVFGFGNRKLSVDYRYTFVDGARTQSGQCRQEQDRASTRYKGKVSCHCEPASDAITVDIGRDAKPGALELGGQHYVVRPLHERESGRTTDEPLGYRIDGEAPLGAVELEGGMWLRRGLSDPERSTLSCVLAGLMLVRPLSYERPAR